MSPRSLSTVRRCLLLSAIAALALAYLPASHRSTVRAQGSPNPCDPPNNAIVCENSKPGNPASEWDIVGIGDDTIQGFTNDISYVAGDTVHFKVDTTATAFRLDIYRLGYYGGLGARKVATVTTTVPTVQPECIEDDPTGLIDCGNWSDSATWQVPLTAVSGIYIARAVRPDTGGASHIAFVVRNDTSHSDLLFQTSDTTWQAYNRYGGNSIYTGGPGTNPGRAYKVSYNRPFITRGATAEDWVFNAEYPMVRYLESNGFDVSYTTGIDTDRRGAEILEHKAFMSVGHDEYWSGTQRANVEAARAAGVNLSFFSGNESFWKIRWEPSIDGNNTSRRTLVCYKETHANAKIDPSSTWTGTWRDPRFSPPADGGRPENGMTGTIFMVNAGTKAIQVPAAFGALRFWRNTSIAQLQPGQTASLPDGTLGYEWDSDLDNGFRPPGLMQLSATVASGVDVLQDYGSNYASGAAAHSLTMYRHSSGALVFSSGSVQWSWGLDGNHDRGDNPPSLDMQQATVNLFADMGVQPQTLQPGLVPATGSVDTLPPTSTITSPTNGAQVPANSTITVTGTAQDAGGGSVAAVEVSVDGGVTWRRASGRTTWVYSWPSGAPRTVSLRSRASDDSGNIGPSSTPVTVTVSSSVPPACPCSIWTPTQAPTNIAEPDTTAVELGVKFKSDLNGFITGIRFYKSVSNTGTHVGNLWTSSGILLSTATFTSESGSGWQQVTFASPVAIVANTIYVASYHTDAGYYSQDYNYFATAGVDNGPLHALMDGASGPNGVYKAGATSFFPTQTDSAPNYWVDVVFMPNTGADVTPPTVIATGPAVTPQGAKITTTVTAAFSEPVNPSTISTSTFELRNASNVLVPGTVSYDGTSFTATFTPSAPLSYATTYTATVKGGGVDPRVKDVAGNALAANVNWSFTTQVTPPPPPDTGPGGPILVVTSTTNPFSKYYAEILRTEGLNAFAVADISTVTSTTLANYDVVLLGDIAITTTQATTLTNWVNGGGNLIAMHPDSRLNSLLGLSSTGSTLSDAYLLVNTTSAPGKGIVAQTIQFHGSANRYSLSGASSVATLYSSATAATSNPAVTVRSVGSNGGQAVAFAFDLARSVVYTRQGNPAWAGEDRDGLTPVRSDDMFFGADEDDPQPDWVDLNKVAIPQADEQQRLLANIIGFVNQDRKPLPRFWYFPSGKKAVLVMTGDDHALGGTAGRFDGFLAYSAPNCSVDDWQCVRGTSYLFPGGPMTSAQAASYEAQGFEVAMHLRTCVDYTPESIDEMFTTQIDDWAAQYFSLPLPTTNRTHCITWSDYTSQAEAEYAHNIRLDTTYYYWPPEWVNDRPGMFTGSGMPMRFAKETGEMVDVYQAVSQMTDESGQSYPFTSNSLFDRALGPEGYYGAFTANMHTDLAVIPQSDALVMSALARGVPIVSAKQMLTWLDARNASTFTSTTWSNNVLTFAVNAATAARNLRTMVPYYTAVGPIASVTSGGNTVPFTVDTIKGVVYAFIATTSGTYQVTYAADTTAPVISGVSASGTSSTATFTWSTNEGATTRVDYGTSPAALTLSATDSSLVTAHSITVSNLTPATQYYFRVTSSDFNGNSTTAPASPAAPATVATLSSAPPVSFTDTTVADFSAGTLTQVSVGQIENGEVVLTPAAAAEFTGSTLPTGWSGVPWTTGGTVTVAGGNVAVDGARVSTDATFTPNASLEFVATFTPQSSQHVGFGVTLSETPWAIFSTFTGGGLYARTNNGSTATDTAIAGNWIGSPHKYRIDWTQSAVVYSIDGTVVVTHPIAVAPPMRPIASDLTVGPSSALVVDWMHLSPYAPTGTFVSRVFDAGSATTWGSAWWTATTPAGTSLAVSVRLGNTAVPDGSWTAFTPVSSSGAPVAGTSRYAQYRATFSSTTGTDTSVLKDVTIGGNSALGATAVSIGDVSLLEGAGGSTSAVFRVTLSKVSPQAVTVNFQTADGTATAGSDYVAASGTVTFPAGTTQQFVSVSVLGDTTVEPDETFLVTLTNATGATIIRSQAVGTIINDDAATPAALSFTDTTAADFSAGTLDAQSYLTQTTDGEVMLAPAAAAEFSGSTLPAGWTAVPWNNGGSATVKQGRVDVEAARLTTDAFFNPGVSLEFVAWFSTESDQHVGLGVTLNETPWAIFSTNNGGALYARTNSGSTSVDTLIPGSWLMAPHRYRIDWTPTNVIYSIDGAVVVNHAIAVSDQMRPIISDYYFRTDVMAVDWMRLTPYAPSSTFLSRVFDGGTSTTWGTASWTAVTSANATVAMSARAGNTPIPDGSWTAFNAIATPGASMGVTGRYVQYRAVLGTSEPLETPILQDVTISGVPQPTLSIGDVTLNEGNAGTTNAQFTVSLSAATAQPVTVSFNTADGTATVGSDYASTSGTLTFPAGTVTQVINVPVTGDTTVEDDETFTVSLTAPSNATLGRAQAVGTILNDDVPLLSIADVSRLEGNSGTSNMTFTVTLSLSTSKTVTVDFATANGTATAGSDYTATSGTLTFPAGSTSQTFNVPIFGDISKEPDETFTVTLSNAKSATIAVPQATGTILSDDLPTMSINDVSVTEGNSVTTNATFTVTLSTTFPFAVTVNYTTVNGTATAGADFTATSGTLTIPANSTSRTITVPVLGDTLDEDNETYTVLLSSPVNATLTKATGVGTIIDNDNPPALSISNASVVEGDSGTTPMVFTVTMSPVSGRSVTVNYATATTGSATAGTDFTTTSGTLTFPAGTTTQTITVPVVGENTVEGNETFVVNLSSATNATISDSQGTGTIVTDDPKLSINNVSVTEANSGSVSATFTVTLSAASSQTIGVNYATANGTAVSGSDYSSTSGTLTFTAGQTSRTITVPVLGDTTNENTETFTVTLTNPSNAGIATAVGTGTIVDNDPAPSLSINNVSVVEGDAGTVNLVYTATLSPASGKVVSVDYATAGGTATSGVDYVQTNGTLTFNAGTTTQTITVPVNGDTAVEANETVLVTLSNPVNAAVGTATGTGTITNDDPKISIGDASVTEGNSGSTSAVFTVTLSASSAATITVNYGTSSGSAASGTDFTSTSGTLTFSPGVTSRTISVPVLGDTRDETNETFSVTLSSPTNSAITDATGTGTILDDDPAPSITINDVSTTEGSFGTKQLTFTVTLSAVSGQNVSVAYATANGTATAGSDYVGETGTVSINAGSTTGTFSITINGDTTRESNETFAVNLSNPVNGTISDAQGIGTITNDD